MTDVVRYVAKPEVSAREEEGGTLLYDPDKDQVTMVNAAGAELWDALAEPRTVYELAERLVEASDGVDLEQGRALAGVLATACRSGAR
jgi:hypothetical protein